jgi:hypothetical protein
MLEAISSFSMGLCLVSTRIQFSVYSAIKNPAYQMLAFSFIRVITMSLRIAWAMHRTNVSLAISAQIFVYVGTIILYIMNWFFAQRIVRSQHPHWGWSTPYRILHRGALLCLILNLCMLIVAAVQQFFTLDPEIRHIDRVMQITGQTYFAAFCFAPIAVTLISLILPRRDGTDKFGAGRHGINITILLVAAFILSTGAIFRCVTTWLPPVPLRAPNGTPISGPWYFSKSCFYTFNFTTEIIIVIAYALLRIDLRFHVPDGSKHFGDYSHSTLPSPYNVGIIGSEKNLKRISKPSMGGLPNGSRDTLHEYEDSLWEDSRTLADSLRYPSSVLEVDTKTGNWKIKRQSGTPSNSSIRNSNLSQPSLWSPDRDTYVEGDAPPVPPLPNWPLRESEMPRGHIPVMEHRNQRSPTKSGHNNEIEGHDYNDIDMGDAIADAIAKLEANSTTNTMRRGGDNVNFPLPEDDTIMPLGSEHSSTRISQMQKAYRPGSSNPWINNPYAIASGSASGSTSSVGRPTSTRSNNPWTQKYVPGSNVLREHEIVPYPPLSSSGTSFATAKAEEEFARFSFEALPREEDFVEQGQRKGIEDQGQRRETEEEIERKKKTSSRQTNSFLRLS